MSVKPLAAWWRSVVVILISERVKLGLLYGKFLTGSNEE